MLSVADDGGGFDPAMAGDDGAYGLAGMRERAELVGGVLDIESRVGTETTVRFSVESRS